jgi:hypothetical protein
MFPRDEAAVSVIRDGRWRLEPHPVEWMIQPCFALPLAARQAEGSGLVGVLTAPAADCFAIATPYAGESHGSLYFSLFGRDLTAGQPHRARGRLSIDRALPPAESLGGSKWFP